MQAKIKNRTVFTQDNLYVLRGMESESVDLIYLDPPFNSNRHYAAPIGSAAAGAAFKDAWTFEDTDDAWWGQLSEEHIPLYNVLHAAGLVGGKGDKAYLIYMAVRLLEMKRILKATGSIYLHCDPTMSHPLKMTMDAIFRKNNFRNEVVWGYRTGGASKKHFSRKHDTILHYGRGTQNLYHNTLKERVYYEKPFFDTKQDAKGNYYADVLLRDVWDDKEVKPVINVSKERTGYPTQKPLALLERIIQASCPPNGMVLDPFCGCATTCVAAERLSRQWIGIDISEMAITLVKERLSKELRLGSDEFRGLLGQVIHRTDIPLRDAPKPTKSIAHILYGKQKGYCNGCKRHFEYQNMSRDHIIPIAKGGADTDENLQLLCGFCNSTKGTDNMDYLNARLKEKGILN